MKRLLPLMSALFVLGCSSLAFAQSAPVTPVTALTLTTGLVAGLGLLAGFITNTLNSGGSILGVKTLPKTWLPYLSLGGTFLGGFTTQVTVGLSTTSVFNGCLMGFYGLLGHTVGVTARQGITAHLVARVQPGSSSDPTKPGPAAIAVASGLAALLVLVGIASTQPACTSASVPTFLNLVSVVEKDLQAGDGDPQILSDVCKALGGSAPTDAVCGDVAVVVADVITYLIDSGAISGTATKRGLEFLAAHPKVSK